MKKAACVCLVCFSLLLLCGCSGISTSYQGETFPADSTAPVVAEAAPDSNSWQMIGKAVAEGKIVIMGAETDEKFLANVMEQVNDKAVVEQMADTFTMVYTPFHGTGYKLIPEALRRLGPCRQHRLTFRGVLSGRDEGPGARQGSLL